MKIDRLFAVLISMAVLFACDRIDIDPLDIVSPAVSPDPVNAPQPSTVPTAPPAVESSYLVMQIMLPEFAGMNAGCHVADEAGDTLGVSNLMILDGNGFSSRIITMDGDLVFFEDGITLTVFCSVWNGPQADDDVLFLAQKEVSIDSTTTVFFCKRRQPDTN